MVSKDAETLFKHLLRDLRPCLREHGFRASSQNFTLESSECWIVINFQKSRWSNAGEKTFYINVAATAKRLLEFDAKPTAKAPPFYCCDWRWRAEHFGPDNDRVKDWTIRDASSAHEVFEYVRTLLLEYVIPRTERMTFEAGLLTESGGFEYPQLKARAVLAAANSNQDELRKALSTLLEKFGSGVVATGTHQHIQRLRTTFPVQMERLETDVKFLSEPQVR